MTDSSVVQLCNKCHMRSRDGDKRHCAVCLERTKARRRALRADGYCISCGKGTKAVEGKQMCPPCGNKRRRKARKKKEQAIRSGVCVSCHKAPRASGRIRCEACLDKLQESQEGRCGQCHVRERPRGTSRCGPCTKRITVRKAEKVVQGLCTYTAGCFDKRVSGRTYCALHAIKDRGRKTEGRHTRRNLVLDSYGGRCSCCGEAERMFLAIDHVNGGGSKEALYGPALISKVIAEDFPPRFQVLCHNCNYAKSFNGRCPHKLAVVKPKPKEKAK